MTYRLVITKPGSLLPVIIDREISLEQRDLILETLDDEGNAYLEQLNRDVAQLEESEKRLMDGNR